MAGRSVSAIAVVLTAGDQFCAAEERGRIKKSSG
jgi:hypothetical protein